jgi:hypothetical protein
MPDRPTAWSRRIDGGYGAKKERESIKALVQP